MQKTLPYFFPSAIGEAHETMHNPAVREVMLEDLRSKFVPAGKYIDWLGGQTEGAATRPIHVWPSKAKQPEAPGVRFRRMHANSLAARQRKRKKPSLPYVRFLDASD